MTTPMRLERELPPILADLAMAPYSRLCRRRPRADRPDAAAARLDVPRKVAPDGHHDSHRARATAAVAADGLWP